MAEYYASTSGTSGGAGTIGDPWDLRTALTNVSQGAGDTLYVRGGTYAGKYQSTLTGGTVRPYQSEVVKIDGGPVTTLAENIDATQTAFDLADASHLFVASQDAATQDMVIEGEMIRILSKSGNRITNCTRGFGLGQPGASHTSGTTVYAGGTNFLVSGDNTTYWNFEVMSSYTGRDNSIDDELARGNGVSVAGGGNKIIHFVAHDTMNGFGSGSASSNNEFYGCLSYNNGMHDGGGASAEGLGHGFYVENNAGFSKIHHCLSLNNYNLGIQGFGQTAAYVGGDWQGFIVANSGAPVREFNAGKINLNMVFGTNQQLIPTAVVNGCISWGGSGNQIGFGAGITTATVTNNYILEVDLQILSTTNATLTGNVHYKNGNFTTLLIPGPSVPPYTINNNTYHNGNGGAVYALVGDDLYTFTNWKSTTGFDADSTETAVPIPDTVIINPSAYVPGRANVVVIAPSSPSTINVDLSQAGLSNGQTYEIRNAFDYYGTLVATGTYDSGSPTIAMSLTGAALNVATPVGAGQAITTTVPDFGAFVVVPTGQTLSAAISGTIAMSGTVQIYG